jgi:hypothetical protein
MRRLLAMMWQQLIDAEAAAVVGAGRYERSPTRTTHRNGSRPKVVAMTSGDVEGGDPEAAVGQLLPVVAAASDWSSLHTRRVSLGQLSQHRPSFPILNVRCSGSAGDELLQPFEKILGALTGAKRLSHDRC